MPIPACHLHGDPLGFEFGGQQPSSYGVEQHDQSSHQMDSMGAGNDIKQRAAWVRSQKNSLSAQDVPDQNLSCKKAETQKDRDAKPRQVTPKTWRNDAHGGELFLLGHCSARQFKR